MVLILTKRRDSIVISPILGRIKIKYIEAYSKYYVIRQIKYNSETNNKKNKARKQCIVRKVHNILRGCSICIARETGHRYQNTAYSIAINDRGCQRTTHGIGCLREQKWAVKLIGRSASRQNPERDNKQAVSVCRILLGRRLLTTSDVDTRK